MNNKSLKITISGKHTDDKDKGKYDAVLTITDKYRPDEMMTFNLSNVDNERFLVKNNDGTSIISLAHDTGTNVHFENIDKEHGTVTASQILREDINGVTVYYKDDKKIVDDYNGLYISEMFTKVPGKDKNEIAFINKVRDVDHIASEPNIFLTHGNPLFTSINPTIILSKKDGIRSLRIEKNNMSATRSYGHGIDKISTTIRNLDSHISIKTCGLPFKPFHHFNMAGYNTSYEITESSSYNIHGRRHYVHIIDVKEKSNDVAIAYGEKVTKAKDNEYAKKFYTLVEDRKKHKYDTKDHIVIIDGKSYYVTMMSIRSTLLTQIYDVSEDFKLIYSDLTQIDKDNNSFFETFANFDDDNIPHWKAADKFCNGKNVRMFEDDKLSITSVIDDQNNTFRINIERDCGGSGYISNAARCANAILNGHMEEYKKAIFASMNKLAYISCSPTAIYRALYKLKMYVGWFGAGVTYIDFARFNHRKPLMIEQIMDPGNLLNWASEYMAKDPAYNELYRVIMSDFIVHLDEK